MNWAIKIFYNINEQDRLISECLGKIMPENYCFIIKRTIDNGDCLTLYLVGQNPANSESLLYETYSSIKNWLLENPSKEPKKSNNFKWFMDYQNNDAFVEKQIDYFFKDTVSSAHINCNADSFLNDSLKDFCKDISDKHRLFVKRCFYYSIGFCKNNNEINRVWGILSKKHSIKDPEFLEQMNVLYNAHNRANYLELSNCALNEFNIDWPDSVKDKNQHIQVIEEMANIYGMTQIEMMYHCYCIKRTFEEINK